MLAHNMQSEVFETLGKVDVAVIGGTDIFKGSVALVPPSCELPSSEVPADLCHFRFIQLSRNQAVEVLASNLDVAAETRIESCKERCRAAVLNLPGVPPRRIRKHLKSNGLSSRREELVEPCK